ncbi:MAG: family metallo-hydrolase [Devosia sp.]|uniref:M20/M25/M40 family metallo-hydrolase n=1 Tax=Devosia sp. TaxID=1871048 RepID=UPI0026279927|nr:M20/M25/M40 family metallo-hydrolase [Devosia sp.]MDB5539567.1 family metallo-hydrolase [Devosia sp.]
MSPALEAALAHADAHLDESVERLKTLVAIKSISTDKAYAGDVRQAAEWLVRDLEALGFDASVRATPGHPMVVAHDRAADGPHVLFYAHYDVQPVDPLNLWHTDPFTATLVNDDKGETRIVGRGTSDDKGQLLTFVEACRAWKAVNGLLPLKVTLFFEGEEESGSKSLPGFLDANREELGAADIALVCDTDLWNAETPSIVTSLRGLVGEEIEITCASHDLHSGMFGNAARNPIQVLADVIASLRNPDGSVAIEGFYDDVRELPADIAAQWKRLPYDEAAFLRGAGLTTPAGETGRSVLEQTRARPTCEINGIIGGYTGDGFKTVIPAKASAKISFRLVSEMDPKKIRAAFRKHVTDRLPPDATVTFSEHGGSPAMSVPTDGPFVKQAAAALKDEWGNEAALIGSGGSIPVAGEFKRVLGLDTLLIGFALDDDRIHSPNEKYDLRSFHKGIRSWLRIIAAFAA